MTGPAPTGADLDPDVQAARDFDFDRMLDYDPYEPEGDATGGTEEKPDAQPANLEDTTEGSQTGETPAPEGQPTEPPKPAAPTVNPELEELRRQLADLAEQNRLLMSVVNKGSAKDEAKEPEKPKEPEVPPVDQLYKLAIPDDLFSAIRSEDPREARGAMNHMLNSLAMVVHNQLRGEYTAAIQKQMGPLMTRLPEMVQQNVQTQQSAAEIRRDFYGTYKDLDDKKIIPIVTQVAQLVMQERGSEAWNAEVRDTVARRTYAVLGKPFPGGQPPAQSKPPVKHTPSGGTRPSSVGRQLKPLEKQIAELLPD